METNKDTEKKEITGKANIKILEQAEKKLERSESKQTRLFANDAMPEMLQVAKNYLDSSQDTADILTPEKVDNAIKYGDYRIEGFKHKGTEKERELGIEMLQEIDIDKLKNLPQDEIRNYFADQFISFIKVIAEPISKKYYLALWKLAGKRGMPIFSGQKVSDLIKEATGKEASQIRQRDRQLATKCLLAWNRIQLKILTGSTKKSYMKGGKRQWKVEKSYTYTKLFNLMRGVEETIIDDKGKILETATIKKIYGNLPFETQSIGAYIPENILLLTGDEGERIDLALEIWKRANQLNTSRYLHGTKKEYETPNFNDKEITWTRSEWIRQAGKTKTDKVNKTKASEYLLADFIRLKELGIITSHPETISTDDNEKITITLKEQGQENDKKDTTEL